MSCFLIKTCVNIAAQPIDILMKIEVETKLALEAIVAIMSFINKKDYLIFTQAELSKY